MPEDSPFLEAVKQMKEKRYEGVVELCTQQIEKGLGNLLFTLPIALLSTCTVLTANTDQTFHATNSILDAHTHLNKLLSSSV